MEEFFDLPTLIVIGIAIFVLFRLRSVLGTRTGNERAPLAAGEDRGAGDRRDRGAAPAARRRRRSRCRMPMPSASSAGSRPRSSSSRTATPPSPPASRPSTRPIPTFSPKSFLEGAKAAYEMIVTAFAQGDRKTLKNLLEKDVYDGFERAIADREAAGNKVDFTFVGLPKVEITEAEIDKRKAQVTVRFNAEVVSATRDKAGALIEGNADQVQTDHRRMDLCAQSEVARPQLEARRHQPSSADPARSERSGDGQARPQS